MEIINVENGNFTLNKEMMLYENQDYEEVMNFNFEKSVRDFGNGYEWIYMRNIYIDALYFSIEVCFFDKKLRLVIFSFSETKIEGLKSWDDVTYEGEIIKQQKFDDWLIKVIGEKRKFSWGAIGSLYDKKSNLSDIHLWYNK